jgi:hypothetical protein
MLSRALYVGSQSNADTCFRRNTGLKHLSEIAGPHQDGITKIRKLIHLMVLLFILYLYLTGVKRWSAQMNTSVLLSILPMLLWSMM